MLSMARGVKFTLEAHKVLLVIAHPDDECMFFSPTLSVLTRQHVQVFVLCLSNGNAEGLGAVREKELLAACTVLRIPRSRVLIVDDPALPDGLDAEWPTRRVAQHVADALAATGADALVTFDDFGVSGHANHRAVHAGVCALVLPSPSTSASSSGPHSSSAECPPGLTSAWQLASRPLLRKFAGALDAALALWLAQPGEALMVSRSPLRGVRAMAAHRSQWVWYRRLFVLLSTYTFVNTLSPLRRPRYTAVHPPSPPRRAPRPPPTAARTLDAAS